jgi:hypothetical protein
MTHSQGDNAVCTVQYKIQGHHTLVETLQGGVSSDALGTIMMAKKMLN